MEVYREQVPTGIIKVKPGSIAELVVVVGDPNRAAEVAGMMDVCSICFIVTSRTLVCWLDKIVSTRRSLENTREKELLWLVMALVAVARRCALKSLLSWAQKF